MTSIPVSRIGDYIREQRESSKLSLRRLAQESGISNPYLSQIERGLRKPSAEILQQIAKALRISAEQLYVQAGLLEDRDTSLAVETAVLADPILSERQKRVLLDIYASFMAEAATSETVPTKSERTTASRTTRAATPKSTPRATRSTHPKPAPKTSANR
jgi:transcriptional regulator with XRE-family HTH domain